MLQCTALALISGSTFMMLKGASIVTTLVFSHWLIDFEVRSRHAVGCALAVLGLAIVGLADIYLADTKGVTSSDVYHAILRRICIQLGMYSWWSLSYSMGFFMPTSRNC